MRLYVAVLTCILISGCSKPGYTLASGDYSLNMSIDGEKTSRPPAPVWLDVEPDGKVVMTVGGRDVFEGRLAQNNLQLSAEKDGATVHFEGKLTASDFVTGKSTLETGKQNGRATFTLKKVTPNE